MSAGAFWPSGNLGSVALVCGGFDCRALEEGETEADVTCDGISDLCRFWTPGRNYWQDNQAPMLKPRWNFE